MALAQQVNYTIDDIYALPDGQRAELIDGQMYMMSPPNTNHQRISYSFARKVSDYIDRKKGNCEVFRLRGKQNRRENEESGEVRSLLTLWGGSASQPVRFFTGWAFLSGTHKGPPPCKVPMSITASPFQT